MGKARLFRPGMPACFGFSLVDLLTTLGVGGILLGLGVPAYSHLAGSSAMTAAVNDMVTHLQLARSEAVKRRIRTIICPSLDGKLCHSDFQAWHLGFILFTDVNKNREADAGEPLLRVTSEIGERIRIATTTGRRRLGYYPNGMSANLNATISFCDTHNQIPPKAVIVSGTGRPRLSDTRSDGSPIDCS